MWTFRRELGVPLIAAWISALVNVRPALA